MSAEKICSGLTLEKCNDPAVRKLGGGVCADVCYNKVGCSNNKRFKYPGQTKDQWGLCYDNIKAVKAGYGPKGSWCVNTKSSTWTSNVNSVKAQVKTHLDGFRCDSIKSDAVTVTVPKGTAETSENIVGEVYLQTNGFTGFKKGQQIIVKGMGEAMVVEIVDSKKSAALFIPSGNNGKLVQDGQTFTTQQLTASRACIKNSDCPVGYCGLNKICINYKKIGKPCKLSKECNPSKSYCGSNRGKKMCVESCNSNDDPRDPQGKCLWNSGNIPLGDQCTKSEDCGSGNCKNGKCEPFFQKFTPSSTSGCGTVPVTATSCDLGCSNIQPGSVFRADLGGCIKPKCAKSNIVSCAYKKYRDMCPTECEAVYPAVTTKYNDCLTILNEVIVNQSKYFKTPSSKYAFMRFENETYYMVKRSDDKIEFILYQMTKNQKADVLGMGLVNGEPNQQWLDTWTNLYKTDSPECRMVHIPAQHNTCANILNVVQGNYFRYFDKVTDTSFYASAFGDILKFDMVIRDSKYLSYKMSYSFHPGKGFMATPCYLNTPVVVLKDLKINPTCNDIIKNLKTHNIETQQKFAYNRPWGYASANWKYWLVYFQKQTLASGNLTEVITIYEFDGGAWKKLKRSSSQGGECRVNINLSAIRTAEEAKGDLPTGAECDGRINGDCKSNLCVNGKCTKCTNNSDCNSGRSGWFCNNGKCEQGCPSTEDPRDKSGKCIWNKGNIPNRKACYGPGTTKGNKSCLGKRCVGKTGAQQGWCASQPLSSGECVTDYGAGPNEICCGQPQGWYNSIYMCPKDKPSCSGYKPNHHWGKCSTKCPSDYKYPVQKGPFVSAGLCYTKEEYANAGSGTVGSWCARTPEKNSSIQQQIKDGEGIACSNPKAGEFWYKHHGGHGPVAPPIVVPPRGMGQGGLLPNIPVS